MNAGDAVVRKLVTFGRILREAGIEVGPGRIQDALRALDEIDLRRRDEVYAALACTLIARRDDLEIFDRATRTDEVQRIKNNVDIILSGSLRDRESVIKAGTTRIRHVFDTDPQPHRPHRNNVDSEVAATISHR